jgi:superoxide reductase
MSKRRDFIKTSVAVAVGAIVTKLSPVSAGQSLFPPGLVYTEDTPGKWAKKVESHLPTVKVDGSKITITTDHGMSEKHYIVRHTLVSGDGKVLGARTFSPDDEEAVSIYKVEGKHPVLYATSFCNKHDLWVKEFSI